MGMDSIVGDLEGKIRSKLEERYDNYISYRYFGEPAQKDFDEWAQSNLRRIEEILVVEDEIRWLIHALTGTEEYNVHRLLQSLLNNGTLTPEEYEGCVRRYLD